MRAHKFTDPEPSNPWPTLNCRISQMMEKFPGEIAGRTFAIQIKSAPVPLELVASSVEEKSAWVHALTGLAALSDDTGTEVLLVQKRSADVNAVSLFVLLSMNSNMTSCSSSMEDP